MSQHIIELDDASFEQHVENAKGLTFVDFWAPWCAPCRIVAPILEKLAVRYAGRVHFTKLNVDEAPRTAAAYQIGSIPTLAIFKDGEPVTGVAGAVPESFLAEMIEKQLEAYEGTATAAQ
ncbi:MAG TPA: thioredoxin [Longimicrobiales bacterium]